MKMLKSYLFWTYERGSFHYDVMVTGILLFLFLAPRFINFRDHPQERGLGDSQLLVHPAQGNAFTFQVGAERIGETRDTARLQAELAASIAPIAGAVQIDRWQALKDASGKVTAYKVWARR
jgi:hypothetical protein